MIKKINIGGQERPLCFNFNCLEEFEEMTGIDPLNGLKKINTKSAKALIYCGLKYGIDEEGRNETVPFDLKTVGAWLDPNTITAAMEAFNSQGEPEQKKT